MWCVHFEHLWSLPKVSFCAKSAEIWANTAHYFQPVHRFVPEYLPKGWEAYVRPPLMSIEDLTPKWLEESDQDTYSDDEHTQELLDEAKSVGRRCPALVDLIRVPRPTLRQAKLQLVDVAKRIVGNAKLPKESQVQVDSTFLVLGRRGSGRRTFATYLGRVVNDLLRGNRLGGYAKFEMDDVVEPSIVTRNGGVICVAHGTTSGKLETKKWEETIKALVSASEQPDCDMTLIVVAECRETVVPLMGDRAFQEIDIPDLTVEELRYFWTAALQEKKWSVETDEVSDAAANAIYSRRCLANYGNKHEVAALFYKASNSSFSRQGNPRVLNMRDVIGIAPSEETIPAVSKVMNDLRSLVACDEMKSFVNSLLQNLKDNHSKRARGEELSHLKLHKVFSGNPGTGKTTCAEIYGRLLRHVGILSHGGVVSKTASDFIGQFIGESQNKTKVILQASQGKVLVIDEAYALLSQKSGASYGLDVLNTLVEKISGEDGEDLVVILCGYRTKMDAVFEANVGLKRRMNFPDGAIEFRDLTPEELTELLNRQVKAGGLSVSPSCFDAAAIELERQRTLPGFGNAVAVKNLLSNAKEKALLRHTGEGSLTFDANDFTQVKTGEDPFAELAQLHNMDRITENLKTFQAGLQQMREENRDTSGQISNFLFLGPPGTGKTTVARIWARVLRDLGLIARNRVVEITADGLQASYLGQTAEKVRQKMREAQGGVLFIDEAHNLGSEKNSYSHEALTELVSCLTDQQHANQTVVILAGYTDPMRNMLNRNAGLASRFEKVVELEEWSAEEITNFIKNLAEKEGLLVEPADDSVDASRSLLLGVKKVMKMPGWGNARDGVSLFNRIKMQRGARIANDTGSSSSIIAGDCQNAVDQMALMRDLLSSRHI
eukprot:GHVN01051922.1.p1 GENE.GHVN01051922.1~~GHVN01051922.1.p1  ORF type:complete len:890 (-),score=83.38 GHVN01051922.1:14-2683(-)